MNQERCCLICQVPLSGRFLKFCCRKHAMKWHNSQQDWATRADRHRKNAARKAAYEANPEFWRNKARQWRLDHPERAKFFAQRQKEERWINPWRMLVTLAKARAKKRNLPFDLTYEWAKTRWTGFCELTGIPFQPRRGSTSGMFSPSLDRIQPTNGYTQNNCRFVLVAVNGLKSDGTDEAMYFVAKSLIEHQKRFPPML